MMAYRLVLPALWLLLALLAASCQGLGGEPEIIATIAPPSAQDSAAAERVAIVQEGGQLWLSHCARCHGELGEGTAEGAPLPDLSGRPTEQLMASLTNGIGERMPAFADTLSEAERQTVLTYAQMISTARARDMIQVQATEEPGVTISGMIRGQVSSGTAGASVPPDLTVELHMFDARFNDEVRTATAGEDGSFRFDDVPIRNGHQYVVMVSYQDVMFSSPMVPGELWSGELELPVTIYETTADATGIYIQDVIMQVGVQDGLLQMAQIVNFVNPTDRAFVARGEDGQTSVSVSVPEGAQFQPWMGGAYRVSADGRTITDTDPVLPGERHLMHLAYTLPYSDRAEIVQSLPFPIAGRVEVMLATAGLSLSADDLTAQEARTMGQRSLATYGGEIAARAGEPFRFLIQGTPVAAAGVSTASGTDSVSALAYVLIGAGASTLLFAGVLALRERGRGRAVDPKAAIADLMSQITDLDKQHEAGKLDAAEYQRRRSTLKARLTRLMQTQER